jgi:hypothetical protein
MEDLNGMISTDQTGRFPIKSLKGKSYIMVLYNYDSNVILAGTMKSRKAPDLVAAYKAGSGYNSTPCLPNITRWTDRGKNNIHDAPL